MLLANEQMEPSDNGQTPDDKNRKAAHGATDEELTPLNWLHEKNLLKGKLKTFVNLFRLPHPLIFRNQFDMPEIASA